MKIILAKDVPHILKPEGAGVRYYLFDEYEVHYNEQLPHTITTRHRHEKIWETLYIIDGELLAKWEENGEEKRQIIKTGDLVEVEHTPHSFANNGDNTVKFIVVKQLLSGENKRRIFKDDKMVEG